MKFRLFSYDSLNLNTANHNASQLHELYRNFSFLCRLTHFRYRLLHSVRRSFQSNRPGTSESTAKGSVLVMASTDRCIMQFPAMWGRNYLHHGQQTIRIKVSDAQGDKAAACDHTGLQMDPVRIQLQTLLCSSKKQHTATHGEFRNKYNIWPQKDEVRSVIIWGDRDGHVWSDHNMRTGDHTSPASPTRC